MDTGRTLRTCGGGRLWAIVKLVLPRCRGSKVEVHLGAAMFSSTVLASPWNTIPPAKRGCILGHYVVEVASQLTRAVISGTAVACLSEEGGVYGTEYVDDGMTPQQ